MRRSALVLLIALAVVSPSTGRVKGPPTKELPLVFREDFEKGHRGFTSVKATLAKYADQLADAPADRALVREQKADVAFLEYDWSLNDARQ